MDVVTAFLNGRLDEEIYMEQPPGYIKKGEEQLVCKLNRSMYGLKQSPRFWNTTLREFLKSSGFKQSAADPCVFVKTRETNISIIALQCMSMILLSLQKTPRQ